ncbi:MAG: signal transduction histidine kinase/ActR/RegA family two-component response regulator [Verrucomicrobiales bacterium]|jgi:signal transduction histidine kinase/ActR/RegA family two-component response regulator/HAMP domain-containing protein
MSSSASNRVLSFRISVLMAMMLVGLGPLLVFWAILSGDLNHHVLSDARSNATERAHGLAERVTGVIGRMSSDLRALQTSPTLRNSLATSEQLHEELARMQDAYDIFREITIYRTDGRFVATTDVIGAVVAIDKSSALTAAVSTNKEVVSPPKRRLGADELFMDIYIPVEDQEKRVFRVIRANTSFRNVQKMLLDARLGQSGYFALTNDSGAILVHKDASHTLLSRLPEFEASLAGRLMIDERDYLAVNHSLSPDKTGAGQAWHLFGYIPVDEARSLVSGSQSTLFFGLALSLGVSIVASLLLAHRLQRNLHPLVSASDAVASQNWNEIDVPLQGPREFREVAASFNQMVARIRSHNVVMQHRIADATARLQATFNSTREALLVVDLNGGIQSVNSRFTELFQLDEAEVLSMGSERLDAMLRERAGNPEGFRTLCEALKTKEDEAEWKLRVSADLGRFNTQLCYLKVYRVDVLDKSDTPLAHMWVFRDFSDARQLEQRLQQAQKMEAVGRLAGGIAHDFNNLLTSIMGNLSLLSVNLKPSTRPAAQLKSARTAAQRAADLIKQLLGFSRKSYLNLKHCGANDLIQEVADLLKPGNDPTAIRLDSEMQEGCWGLHVDPGQINQVLMNLCVNSRDALEEKGRGGDIILRSENCLILNHEAVRLGGENCKGGQYVVLSVRDTGAGISPEILERIFEPFFTTKDQGKGTGLGLATSYGIVEQHGGWMTCQSEVGVGTTFKIYLPRDVAVIQALPERQPTEDEDEPAVKGGTETILLVDDDPEVRQVSETFLTQCGYEIITAGDGEVGLEVFETNRGNVSCVVLDLTMPKLSGADTFKRLRETDPDLPVIIYSGYVINSDEFETQNGSRPNAILCKPFDLGDMANLIRDVLDGSMQKTGLQLAA